MKIREVFNLDKPAFIKDNGFYCGCELEIEDVHGYGGMSDDVVIEEDNSLRNNGKEFKIGPCNKEKAISLFKHIHENLILGPEPFSERTSIHVHVNVQELSLEQVKQFVLVYALFEPLFFEFVGEQRKNSIYCVPLNYTFLPNLYKLDVIKLHEKWHKYTAFNLLPIGPMENSPALGTVEFRHLYGTNNIEIFSKWLDILSELYLFIENYQDFDMAKGLQEDGDIYMLLSYIIPTFAKIFDEATVYRITEDTLLDVKLSDGGV